MAEAMFEDATPDYVEFIPIPTPTDAVTSSPSSSTSASTSQAPITVTSSTSQAQTTVTSSTFQAQTTVTTSQVIQPVTSSSNQTNGLSFPQRRPLTRSISLDVRCQSPPKHPPPPPPRTTNPEDVAKAQGILRRLQRFDQKQLQTLINTDQSRRWSDLGSRSVLVVKRDYHPQAPGEIAFRKDDILEVVSSDDVGWEVRNLYTKERGYVPSFYVAMTPVEKMKFSGTSRLPVAGQRVVRAVREYTAEAEASDELSYKAGDVLIVLNDTSRWWYARHTSTGKEGFVFMHFLRGYCEDKGIDEDDDRNDITEDGDSDS